VTQHDHAPDVGGVRLSEEAPLARAAVWASLAGVVLGFLFLPQVLGLALGGISLTREPRGRKQAGIAIAVSLALIVGWGVVLGLVLKWWAASQLGT
jgi:uncharacterized protein YqgC (DUF456 family)